MTHEKSVKEWNWWGSMCGDEDRDYYKAQTETLRALLNDQASIIEELRQNRPEGRGSHLVPQGETAMNFHFRADDANRWKKALSHYREVKAETYTRITVFANGRYCGNLCMKEDEALYFHQLVMTSRWSNPEEVITSGIWAIPKEDKP